MFLYRTYISTHVLDLPNLLQVAIEIEKIET
jgi:hypothetical protein